jgi:RNA polymerase sigma factor (sigma-70 family)
MTYKPLYIAAAADIPGECVYTGKASTLYSKDLDDYQLWHSMKEGDKQALSAIYQTHFPSLYNYGLKISRNKELIKDCIQDLFIELWKTRQQLSQTNAIRPYLYTCLRRKVIEELNGSVSKMVTYEGMAHPAFEVQASHEANLILDQVSKAQKERLAAAVNALTKRQREIIFLRYYENLSFPEIATIMGLHIDSTYVLLSQATTELRKTCSHDSFLTILLAIVFI